MKNIGLGKKPPKIFGVNNKPLYDNYEIMFNHLNKSIIQAADEIKNIREYYPHSVLAREGWLQRIEHKLRVSVGEIKD